MLVPSNSFSLLLNELNCVCCTEGDRGDLSPPCNDNDEGAGLPNEGDGVGIADLPNDGAGDGNGDLLSDGDLFGGIGDGVVGGGLLESLLLVLIPFSLSISAWTETIKVSGSNLRNCEMANCCISLLTLRNCLKA